MADATSSSHRASSSLNGDTNPYRDGALPEESHAFPSLAPLSHELDLLSPVKVSKFSVDDFLLSRTKASDLNFILSDLRTYSEKLKDELYSIINEDYKDFVSLGSSLKAEAHRIARLGWNARSLDGVAADAHVPPQGLLAPVRDTLLASRSMLKSVQEDIEGCIKRKEDATSQKARLELMLSLHDSITRLEDLLLIQTDKPKKDRRRSSHAARQPSLLSITPAKERRQSVVSDSDQDGTDYAMSSGYEDNTDSEDDISSDESTANRANGDVQPKRARGRILRRFSSNANHAPSPVQQRGSADALAFPFSRTRSDTFASTAASSSSMLGLPQRIARTSAEYSRLRFLHRRIDEENLTDYADTLQDRIETVRTVLRQDLRKLLRALVSPNSLLTHGQTDAKQPTSLELRRSSRPSSGAARRASFLTIPSSTDVTQGQPTSELDVWSQVAEPTEADSTVEAAYWDARLEEQRSWLEMVLTTLNTLTLVSGQAAEGELKPRNEAEEAVRDLLVSEWADKVIVNDKDQVKYDASVQAVSKNLPLAVQGRFEDHRNKVQSLLLSPSEGSPSPLVGMYNSILTFVASTAWHVCDASRGISDQIKPTAIDGPLDVNEKGAQHARCDVFTNAVWDELSSRLLETMGSTIFFVGQTDTFYSNFELTNAFLQRFLSLAPTNEARTAMQQHPNWLAFKRRWQLPVYFQMRFREVVLKLEAQLVDGRQKQDDEGAKCMLATKATLDAIERVWSEGVHIHELSAREWRVTLQMLSRYKTWVEEQFPTELGAATNGVSNRPLEAVRGGGGTGSDGSRNSFDRRGSNEISRVSTPQPPPDLTSQQHEDEQLQFATELLADCFTLRARVGVQLDETILARIAAHLELPAEGGGLDELRTDLMRVLNEESLDFIPGLTASVGRLVYSTLFPRAASPLRLLRSFSTPAYRSSPNNPSPAVQAINQILQPLTLFLRSPTPLPDPIVRDWIQHVLSDTFKRYTSTVETINKNQQSLIRLKKSQSGGMLGMFKSNTGEGAVELEKQFAETNRLALETWRKGIEALELGIEFETWDAWIALKSFLTSELDSL